MDYSRFKSGSDVRGFALGDESNPLFLGDEVVRRIAAAFVVWLKRKTMKNRLLISVGRDPRLSSERMKRAVVSALTSNGADVADCSLSSTPAMFMTTVEAGCDAAVQITASHLPKDRNGLKFFIRRGGLDGSEISEVLKIASEIKTPAGNGAGKITRLDFMKRYSEILRRKIIDGAAAEDKLFPLEGLKIVVDAGNGAGGFYATDVLGPLGADVSDGLFLEPDGEFPNHSPNPENAEAMARLAKAVLDSKADLGVIFDADVDRAACVDKNGFEINRNRLAALASKIALADQPGGTIVTDSATSDGLSEFIAANGGVHLRYKRGYRNVISKQIELVNKGVKCPLAVETSGHASFSENYFLDDGAYLITKLIVKAASLSRVGLGLTSLISGLRECAEEREARFPILRDDYKREGERIISFFEKAARSRRGWSLYPDNYEGVRIKTDAANGDGWFLIRASVHDPTLVLNVESDSAGGVKNMCGDILEIMLSAENADNLDVTALAEFVKRGDAL